MARCLPGLIFLSDNGPARLGHLNHTAGPALAAALIFVLVGRVAAADPEGFEPCPVRVSKHIQLLFLEKFGDRTGVLNARHNVPSRIRRSA